MRKPEQTAEPSIEEILASIRRIIADEGSSVAPVFGQTAPDLAAERHQQPHYEERYDERRDPRHDEHRHEEHREHHYDEPRAREHHYEEREPRYEGPHHQEQPRHGPRPQTRDFIPDDELRDQRYNARGDYRDREPVGADYDYESGAHTDFRTHDRAANDFDRDDAFERGGDTRDSYQIQDHASAAFDPYATHDDYEVRPLRPVSGNEDEILELTEDFMVEEMGAVEVEPDGANDETAPDAVDYAYMAMSLAEPKADDASTPSSIPAFTLDMDDGDLKVFSEPAPVSELEQAPITTTMAPVTEGPFTTEGLDSVLSNVVAEMQRLSEGKGLSALLETPAPQPEPESAAEQASPAGEPPQPQSWQPRARQASSTPAQRPVWSARRLDSEGSSTSQRASTQPCGQGRERSRSASVMLADGSPGVPFGEVGGAKAATQRTASPQAQTGGSGSGAPTALARNANLKTSVEEVMPDLPEGDFPPESGSSTPGRTPSKAASEAIAAVRAPRKQETGIPEETPELPGDPDEEIAVQAAAVTQPPVKQPPQKPVAHVALVETAQVPAAAPAQPQQQPVQPIAAAAAKVLKGTVEKAPMAALPNELEEGVREMLKPLVTDWLKDNLPRLVEEVLRDEIRNSGPLGKRGGKE